MRNGWHLVGHTLLANEAVLADITGWIGARTPPR
jgi:hypothetical protein